MDKYMGNVNILEKRMIKYEVSVKQTAKFYNDAFDSLAGICNAGSHHKKDTAGIYSSKKNINSAS